MKPSVIGLLSLTGSLLLMAFSGSLHSNLTYAVGDSRKSESGSNSETAIEQAKRDFDGHYQLLLVGGALNTCSSMALKNCQDPEGFRAAAKSSRFAHYVQLTPDALAAIAASPYFIESDQIKLEQLNAVLQQMASQHEEPLTHSDFKVAFKNAQVSSNKQQSDISISGQQLYQQLSDHNWFLLLDYLQVTNREQNLPETVGLAQSQDLAGPYIFQQFVEMSKKSMAKNVNQTAEKPRILVMTSSARDSFEAIEFYLQAFEQAGADAQWFPLDLALATALKEQRCDELEKVRAEQLASVNRAVIYPKWTALQASLCQMPEQLMTMLQHADGLFINGGDQSLTMNTWQQAPQSLYQLLHQRFTSQHLVVGGTSAGAAVQSGGLWQGRPIPMISSGQSYSALKYGAMAMSPAKEGCDKDNSCQQVDPNALTYRASGGLGLISAGIVDTHFSERGRQARLIMLAATSKIPFAFGVDETSALQVAERGEFIFFRAIGKQGVWLFDLNHLEGSVDSQPLELSNIKAHYLSYGDRAVVNKATGTLQVEIAAFKNEFNKPQKKLVEQNVLYRDRLRQLANALALSKRQQALGFSHQNTPRYRITLTKSDDFIARLGIYSIAQQPQVAVSFSPLLMRIEALNERKLNEEVKRGHPSLLKED